MRKGGGKGGRGMGSRGGNTGRCGVGIGRTRVANRVGFASSFFALLSRMIGARRTNQQPDAGKFKGVGNPEVAGFRTASLIPLPIARRSQNPQKTGTRRRAFVTIEKCAGCGICIEACPTGAITLNRVVMIDAEKCTGCGRCLAACSQGALTLKEIPQGYK